MNEKNFSFLKGITDDDRIMLSRLLDWTYMAEEKYVTKYSFFMDERQWALCEQVLASNKFENYLLWGGFDNAVRRVIGIFPPYSDMDKKDFPIVPLTFEYRKEDKLSHRDFLGSLMGLKISRECVGDILVGEGRSVAFVRDTVADEVLANVRKIGRVGVKVSVGFDESAVAEVKFQELSGTVASLRVDSVLSLALRISREKANVLIKSTGVEINHVLCNMPKTLVQEGDKFSVRGFGKFILLSVNGATKKDRLHITVGKYI